MDEQTLAQLTWLIPLPPILSFFLISFLVNWRVFRERRRVFTAVIALAAIGISWLISLVVAYQGWIRNGAMLAAQPFTDQIAWLPVGPDTYLHMGVTVDPLTVVGLFFVPLTAGCIFLYSHGYMMHDPRYSRFFSYISLFAGGMLTLVVTDNLLLLFIGWEIMGLCSYLLIGFWFDKDYPEASGKTMNPRKAAVRAFITTRVGDVFMLLGIAYLYVEAGTLNYQHILRDHETLEHLATTFNILPGVSAASLVGILLVIGAIGKSAQFPLHVWLPDAMEGPTPVSAMIHAATMVSAGVFMVIRMFPIMQAGYDYHHGDFAPPMILLAVVGAFTALFSATMAVAQDDVKGVLAYSTISQLGYMFAALGIGAYVAATFHLLTHAIFKALLFMGSGSVIHAMEHGEHHVHEHGDHNDDGANPAYFDPQDMRNMGGLRHKMPWTFITFLIGGLALAGFPIITSGFWSKDEIIADALYLSGEGIGLGTFVLVMLVAAAFLTAFYTMRQITLTFLGKPRTQAAEHAEESHWSMWAPLVLLAGVTLVIGFIGVHPDFPVLNLIYQNNPFFEFIAPLNLEPAEKLDFNLLAPVISIVVSLGGLLLGYLVYRGYSKSTEKDPIERALSTGFYRGVLQRGYRIDDLYRVLFIRPAEWVSAEISYRLLDRGIIDGILGLVSTISTVIGNFFRAFNSTVIDGVGDGIPMGVGWFARWFQPVQSGKIQEYLLVVLMSALLIGIIFIIAVTR